MSNQLNVTAATIMITRERMANQLRLNNPLSEDAAWTLLRDAHLLDYRRLAAHRLFDLAIAGKNSAMIDTVAWGLEKDFPEVLCPGLLRRLRDQTVHQGWARSAKRELAALQSLAA